MRFWARSCTAAIAPPAQLLASEHLWIVDPIDGTSNFVHGIPHFGVSVAYYHKGQPACGVMGKSGPR